MEKEYYVKWKQEFSVIPKQESKANETGFDENMKKFLGLDQEDGKQVLSVERQERIEELKRKTANTFTRSDAMYNPDKCTVGIFYDQSQTDSMKKEDMIDIDRKSRASNTIFSPNTYRNDDFKKEVFKTTNQAEHHDGQFIGEPNSKEFNLRRTVISEYSNAKHNQTVFINPRFMSC